MFKIFLAVVIGMLSFTSNTFAADSNLSTSLSSHQKIEMDTLAQLEKLHPELQNQVAGRCTKFWDVNLGKYEGVSCPSAFQEGMTWGLIGLLLGSLGSASTMTACAVGGFAFGYLNHSDY